MVVAGTGARNLAIPASTFGRSEATTALLVKYWDKNKPAIPPPAARPNIPNAQEIPDITTS
jgi:hypothetical protein